MSRTPCAGQSRVHWAAAATGAAAVLTAAGLTASACAGPARRPGASRTLPAAPHFPPPDSHEPGSTWVAELRHDAPSYRRPGARPTGSVPARWFARPSVLPVIATRSGWVRVRLAQRPNGTTAWLRTQDVILASTPYRIVINRATTHLKLYHHGRLIFSTPAGIGTPDDPTPLGTFFVAFDTTPPRPNPGYGSFIMVTSAHSPAIRDWNDSGDAVIGIHGPLGEDKRIGTRGAKISHGCIRLHTQALTRLRDVPPGTPIEVIE